MEQVPFEGPTNTQIRRHRTQDVSSLDDLEPGICAPLTYRTTFNGNNDDNNNFFSSEVTSNNETQIFSLDLYKSRELLN
jgi:hypothetical protein